MKRINRLLCFILAFLIVTSSVPVFALENIPAKNIIDYIFRFDVGDFLGDEESKGDDPEIKRIEFLDAIGIWDDSTISKDALITMTDFLEIMSKVRLGSENAFLNVYSQDPDESKVTYKDAFEYLLHATGYYYRCAQFGNTPESLLIVASDIDLISDYPEDINAFITRGELAKLITKAVTIDLCIMEYTIDGGYRYTVTEGENLLSMVHGIYDVGGFVNAIPGLAVYGDASLKKGYIQIERTNVNASGMDITDYFGTRVDAYAFFDDVINEYKLVYIAPAQDNRILEIDFKDIVGIRGNEIEYIDENENEFEITLNNFVNIVENGVKLTSLSQMSDYRKNEGKIRLVASEKSSGYDTAIIYKYDYYVVDYIDTMQNRIGIKYGMTHNGAKTIPINDKAENNIIIDGVISDYTKVPIGKVIRVMQCADTGYTEIIVSSEKPSGEITMVYDDIIEVAGKNYRISKNMLNRIEECKKDTELSYNDKLRMPELGTNVTLYVYGNVVAGYTSGQEYQYAYLKSAALSRSSIDPEATIRVYTQMGEWIDLSFADKITLDGTPGVSKQEASDFIVANADAIIGELCRIKVTKEGKCTVLDTIIPTEAEAETTDDITHVPDYQNGRITAKTDWTKWNLYISSGERLRYLLNTTTPVFVIPEDQSREDKFKVVMPSSLGEGNLYDVTLYNPNDFHHLGAIVFHGELDNVVSSDVALTWFYVENMRRVVIDADNLEYGYRVMGQQYVNQRAKGKGVCQDASYIITDEQYETAKKKGEEFVVGDFLRIDVMRDRITGWSFEQGIERGTSKITLAPGVYDLGSIRNNDCELVVGHLIKMDVAEMLFLVDCGDAGTYVYSPRAKGIIDVDAQKNTNADFADYYEDDLIYAFCNGANASFIFKTVNAE